MLVPYDTAFPLPHVPEPGGPVTGPGVKQPVRARRGWDFGAPKTTVSSAAPEAPSPCTDRLLYKLNQPGEGPQR